MADDKNRAVVTGFVEEAVNGRHFELIDEFLSEDVALPPGIDGALDRQGLKAVLQYYISAFPDLHYAVEDMVSEGDRVVARLTMSGTHQGDYDGHAGTGKHFAVDEVDLIDLHDGRITGYRIVWDELGFRRQ